MSTIREYFKIVADQQKPEWRMSFWGTVACGFLFSIAALVALFMLGTPLSIGGQWLVAILCLTSVLAWLAAVLHFT